MESTESVAQQINYNGDYSDYRIGNPPKKGTTMETKRRVWYMF